MTWFLFALVCAVGPAAPCSVERLGPFAVECRSDGAAAGVRPCEAGSCGALRSALRFEGRVVRYALCAREA